MYRGLNVTGQDINRKIVESGIADILVGIMRGWPSGERKAAKVEDFEYSVMLTRGEGQHEVLLVAETNTEIMKLIVFPVSELGLVSDQKDVVKEILNEAAKELLGGVV
jgi:hypothetical protein